MVDWLIIFTALLAVIAVFRSGIKYTIARKGQQVADVLLWERWTTDNEGQIHQTVPRNTELFQPEQNVQAKTVTFQAQGLHTQDKKDASFVSNSRMARTSATASVAVPKDQQEYMLTATALNDLGDGAQFDMNVGGTVAALPTSRPPLNITQSNCDTATDVDACVTAWVNENIPTVVAHFEGVSASLAAGVLRECYGLTDVAAGLTRLITYILSP
jgi:hypothetical protein